MTSSPQHSQPSLPVSTAKPTVPSHAPRIQPTNSTPVKPKSSRRVTPSNPSPNSRANPPKPKAGSSKPASITSSGAIRSFRCPPLYQLSTQVHHQPAVSHIPAATSCPAIHQG